MCILWYTIRYDTWFEKITNWFTIWYTFWQLWLAYSNTCPFLWIMIASYELIQTKWNYWPLWSTWIFIQYKKSLSLKLWINLSLGLTLYWRQINLSGDWLSNGSTNVILSLSLCVCIYIYIYIYIYKRSPCLLKHE